MTLSKTKLVAVDRKYSFPKEQVIKAVLDTYAELGITLPEKKKRKPSKSKTENI